MAINHFASNFSVYTVDLRSYYMLVLPDPSMEPRLKTIFWMNNLQNIVLLSLATKSAASGSATLAPWKVGEKAEFRPAPALLKGNLHFDGHPIV